MKSPTDISNFFDRFGAIPGLCVTSLACYTLLGLQIKQYRGSEDLLAWTQARKANVTILVQVLSHILGLIHVQAICSLLTTSFVRSLKSKSFPIYQVHFIQAAATPRLAWSLPTRYVLLLLLIVAWSFLPAAMWAGALAPLPSERNATYSLTIPTFNIANLTQLWEYDNTARIAGFSWMDSKGGLFSDDPSSSKGVLTASASDAFVLGGEFYKHAKLDKTGYSYTGRSYGAGSIAGFNTFVNVTRSNWFSYVEQGIYSKVSCFYNGSSQFKIERISSRSQTNLPALYQAQGRHANGESAGFTTYMAWVDHDMFVWTPAYVDASQTMMVEMTTLSNQTNDPWGFSRLDKIQCNVQFSLRNFSVLVNTTSKSITSTPLDVESPKWSGQGKAVAEYVKEWVGSLGLLDTGCSGGCPLGKSIVANYQQLQDVKGSNSTATTLTAVENYIASLTDNLLVHFRLLRLVGAAPQPTEDVTATVNIPAITFGDFEFIVIVASINLLICIAYIIQLIRTRGWSGIPALDLSNVSDIIVGSWRGAIYQSEITTDEMSRRNSHFNDSTKMTLRCSEYSESDSPMLVPLPGQAVVENSPRPSIEVEKGHFI